MHENNCFITLTYSDEKLESPKLIYSHFQKFIKDLRNHLLDDLQKKIFPKIELRNERRKLWNQLSKQTRDQLYSTIQISSLQTGEYGDEKKRPHWHAIIFNWKPSDLTKAGQNALGDTIYHSKFVDTLWGRNDAKLAPTQIVEVTLKSAGYVARYALKKMAHDVESRDEYKPIPRRSCKNAIGKSYYEKFWPDMFNYGQCLEDGKSFPIPRYYEKLHKKIRPEEWKRYVTQVKSEQIKKAEAKEAKISLEEKKRNFKRSALKGLEISRSARRKKILEQKTNKMLNQKV